MKSFVVVSGPKDAGPGERQEMLHRATRVLEQLEAETVVRVDVPGKGSGESVDESARTSVEPLIPALQSGSLFGGRIGILVVDAQNLLKTESEVIAALVEVADPASLAAVFVATGPIPSPLREALKSIAETLTVKKFRERDAGDWLVQAARARRLKLSGDAVAALLARFGSDVAALGQALDLLAGSGEEVTAEAIHARFRNRPDEPFWHYSDALAAGDVGQALRRLEDFLEHGHPLQLMSFLEGELRRRALAAAAPNMATFAEWAGMAPKSYALEKAWRQRTEAKESDLRRALDALRRADLLLKEAPEATHRVSLERLTVALCRWYGGRTGARA